MKLNMGTTFWAVAIVSAVSYAICAAFVAVAPAATSQAFGWVMHIDLTSLGRHITWPSFFGGMVCFSLVIAAHAWAAAWIYNRLGAGPVSVKS